MLAGDQGAAKAGRQSGVRAGVRAASRASALQGSKGSPPVGTGGDPSGPLRLLQGAEMVPLEELQGYANSLEQLLGGGRAQVRQTDLALQQAQQQQQQMLRSRTNVSQMLHDAVGGAAGMRR